jgi:uncharacterized protein
MVTALGAKFEPGDSLMKTELPEVVQALLNPKIYPDKTPKVELMQTQMSFVFLTGKYVYKIKKPVNLGYLDYSTLEKRHFFCRQEVELNRRLSPEAYLGVIPVISHKNGFALGGKGQTVEYAVKMLHLPQDCMLNVLLEHNRATPEMLDKVALKMVDFHARAATNPEIQKFGKTEAVKNKNDENFSQTEKYLGVTLSPAQYQQIKDYTNGFLARKGVVFDQRADAGRVRDCHGDLHSQHICFAETLTIYDCIEFNDRFRYCDVASEIAFLGMDLDHFGRADLARSFVNSYIKLSGDEAIHDLLRFFKCYLAYVRGKVNCFKFDDPYISETERKQTREAARSYFDLAQAYAYPRPLLFVTVGLTGTGKTTVSNALARRLGLTVLSSDIIRKQLAGVPLTERHHSEPDTGLYTAEMSQKTYARLFAEAEALLKSGQPVVLDATFIKSADRQKALDLAHRTGADVRIVESRLDEAHVKERLEQRARGNSISDGRWEIYEPQKNKFEPISEVEPRQHFVVDTAQPLFDQLTPIVDSL